jgi:SAM-dependent methyltransferase
MTIQQSSEPDAFREFEQTGWDRIIEHYQRAFGPLTAQTSGPLLDAAQIDGSCRVLDVCTGHGVLAAAAIERGAHVIGVDIGHQVLRQARRNVPRAEFRQADAEALPVESGSFDAVLCGYGIIHLATPARGLLEMHRVMKLGARIAVSVWDRPSPANGFGLLFGAIRAHGRFDIPLPNGPDMFQFSDGDNLADALAATGFAGVIVARVEQTWHLARSSDFIDAFLHGVVRGGALLAGQTPDALAAIRSATETRLEREFRVEDGYAIRMDALVGSGTKG